MSSSYFVTSSALSESCTYVLPDCGAEFSAINRKIVERDRLHVTPPSARGIQTLGGADTSMSTARIGTVTLHITVHYPLEYGQPARSCTFDKTFEVMDLQEDMLLGAEVFSLLWPNILLNNYIAHKSEITDWPFNVIWSGPPTVDSTSSASRSDDAMTRAARALVVRLDRGDTRSPVNTAVAKAPDRGIVEDLFDEGEILNPEQSYVAHPTAASTAAPSAVATVGAYSFIGRNLTAGNAARVMHGRDDITIPLSEQPTGFGGIPIDEIPNRMQSYTIVTIEAKSAHELRKSELMHQLAGIHAINEKGNGTGFCTDPDSVVTLSVQPGNEDKLFRKQYSIPQALLAAMDAVLERWLAAGKIKLAPKNTRYNSPLLVVPKKDENGKMTKVRVCIDIRMLNMYLLENDRFQLPFIPDVLAAFGGGKLFGEYDLSEAYYQFRVAEESQKYTAFTWRGKQYVCVGCPFGIKHIPSLFQRFMVNLFSDLPFVFRYNATDDEDEDAAENEDEDDDDEHCSSASSCVAIHCSSWLWG